MKSHSASGWTRTTFGRRAKAWEHLLNNPIYADLPAPYMSSLVDLKADTLPSDTLDELAKLSNSTRQIPEDIADALDDGNTAPFLVWLESDPKPETEIAGQLEKTDLIPTNIAAALDDWQEKRQLNARTLDELAKFAGRPVSDLPADLKRDIDAGNFTAYTNWLDQEFIRTSKTQYARLQASDEALGYPEGLLKEIDDWYNRNWLLGAVKQLDLFADEDVRKSLR